MASLTGKLVADTYRALLKTIDNDILIASEKQITDGLGGGSGIFLDSQGFIRANKYKVTNGLSTQFLKADGSIDGNTYLTGITSSQVIMALGYTPVTNQRTLTINNVTYNLSQNRSWTIEGTAAVWGNITGTLSNQTDLQTALNGKFNNPTGTILQYIRGDGTLATYNSSSSQIKNEVKLGAALTKGTPVYVSSANGTNMIVSASSNTTEATSSKTFGLLETGGALNDLVQCVTYGLLAGLDTSAATTGDPVWLGVNGALLFGLANKPYAPAHMVYIGVVTRVQQNNGEIFVNVQNGFELDELHNVAARTPSNNDGLFYETSTSLWKNKSIATVLGYVPQPQLNGTGFVKASGTTISYDNSDYQPLDADLTAIAGLALTTGLLRKNGMNTWELDQAEYLTIGAGDGRYESLSNKKNVLVANSTTYYYSVTAINNALADKMNVNGGTFTGNLTVASSAPSLILNDTSSGGVFRWVSDGGQLFLQNGTTTLTTLMSINSSGAITNASSIAATSFIKSGGSSGQFLKADGSVDANSYQPLDADLTAIAALALTTGLLRKNGTNTWELDQNQYITTADLSGYQTIANLSTNLTASSTKYPNVNAVNTGLGLRLALAGGTMTGNLIMGYSVPTISLNDTSTGTIYHLINDGGTFKLNYLTTNIVSIGTGGAITAGSFIKSGGTSSQYLMADGSVTTGGGGGGVSGSGTTSYIPKWTSGTALGNSVIYDNGTNIGIGTASPYDFGLSTMRTLQVEGSGYGTVITKAGTVGAFLISDSPLLGAAVGTYTNHPFKFTTNNVERAQITTTGNFGIATTTPMPWGGSFRGLSVGQTSIGCLPNTANAYFTNNIYYDGTNFRRGIAGAGAMISINDDSYSFGNVATGTAGAIVSVVERLKIGSNGFVGIGGPGAAISLLEVKGGTPFIRITDTTTTGENGLIMDANGAIRGGLTINYGSGEFKHYCGIAGNGYFQTFHTNGSERFRITASGMALFNSTTDNGTAYLQIGGTSSTKISLKDGSGQNGMRWETVGGANAFYLFNGSFGPGPGWGLYNIATGGLPFWIQNSGAATFGSSVTATSFFESSDMRLKTLIDESGQIDGIENLEAKLYKKDGKIEFGYFAQDAEKLMPYAVTKNMDGFLSLSYREVHTAKIARLEKRVAELEKQLNAA